MSADMSFFHLIAGASFVVQLVMLLLLVVSVVSWTMIFRRHAALRDAREAADEFEDRFWSGGDLSSLFREVSAQDNAIGMAGIFQAGFNEFARLRSQKGVEPRAVVEGAQRVMRVVLSREMDSLETHLSFLATVGSTSPYVGLFGTVWGIMGSFHNIGLTGAANLAKLIGELSGGRLQIQVFGAGELVPAFEVFDAVSQGVADAGHGGVNLQLVRRCGRGDAASRTTLRDDALALLLDDHCLRAAMAEALLHVAGPRAPKPKGLFAVGIAHCGWPHSPHHICPCIFPMLEPDGHDDL